MSNQDRDSGEMEAILAALESAGPEALGALMPPQPEPSTYLVGFSSLADIETEDVAIQGPEGDVPSRVYRPRSGARGVALVWVHGGGFAGGDLDMAEAHWVSLMLAERGIGVLSVDYRKCGGGVHYPAPSDDVRTAWVWATEHAEELGAVDGRVHLGGASAGASLAAGVAKRLRDDAGRLPASLVLVYPTVHPELATSAFELIDSSDDSAASTAQAIYRLMNLNYVGSAALLDDPYAFPGLGDLRGQPPVYILNSEADALRSSGEAYADGLRNAAVSVTVETEPGTGHGHLNEPDLLAARKSLERIVAWLELH